MKKHLVRFATVVALVVSLPAIAQLQPGNGLVVASVDGSNRATEAPKPQDPRFDLDFPGGPPAALVAAIGERSGKSINVIIPEEFADTKIPPMKLRQVAVPALFDALLMASQRTVERSMPVEVQTATGPTVRASTRSYTTSYGFRANGKEPNHESVWYFFREGPWESRSTGPSLPAGKSVEEDERVSLAFLGDALKAGHTVEDITTAVRTGCELLPGGRLPKMKYHKETKLLFISGRPEQLQISRNIIEAICNSPVESQNVPVLKMDPALARRYGLMPPSVPLPSPETPAEPASKDSPRKP